MLGKVLETGGLPHGLARIVVFSGGQSDHSFFAHRLGERVSGDVLDMAERDDGLQLLARSERLRSDAPRLGGNGYGIANACGSGDRFIKVPQVQHAALRGEMLALCIDADARYVGAALESAYGYRFGFGGKVCESPPPPPGLYQQGTPRAG